MKYGLELSCENCGDRETIFQGSISNVIESTPNCGMCDLSDYYSYFWRNYPEDSYGRPYKPIVLTHATDFIYRK